MNTKKILWPIFFVVQSPLALFVKKVKGKNNFPKHKRVIIALNHYSFMDATLIYIIFYLNFRIKISFLAHEDSYKNYFLRGYLNFFDSIKVEDKNKKKSLEHAHNYLNKNISIGIFPEGGINSGSKKEAKTGVIRLALETNSLILPVKITNTHKILPKGSMIPKLRRTDIIIGEAINLYTSKKESHTYEELKKMSEDILNKIYDLK